MSDSEEEVTFSLGTLAQEIEDLKRSQRVIVVPKERQVSKFTGNTQQVAVRDFKEEVLAAYKAQDEDKLFVEPCIQFCQRRTSLSPKAR